MSLRDILVFLDGGSASEGRLQLAVRIAREHGADLSGVFLHDDQAGVLAAELAEQQFRACHTSIGGDWHRMERRDPAGLIALARTADLVVLGQINPHVRPAPWWRPDEIMVDCGRPVLMVPYVGSFTEIGRRVLIAWDGSREAARALHDALPVIGTATAVTVIMIRSREHDLQRHREATRGVIRHLARHDIAARADHPLRSGNAISDMLLSAAMDVSADLIVAGAYHHSPLRETLIGGVSRELLQAMTVPVLMSH